MSKRDPKFNTKYENVDPDFVPDTSIQSSSSSSQAILTRSQKLSKIIATNDLNKSIQNIVISDDESDEENDLTTSIYSSLQQLKMSLTQEQINQIVQAVITAQQTTVSNPKVMPEKLNDKNYVDWSKKMKNALKLNQIWVDPSRDPAALNPADKTKNERAALYMSCFLDEKHSSFINDNNEKCFISAWNAIAKFKEPRTSTVLVDIHSKIQRMKKNSFFEI